MDKPTSTEKTIPAGTKTQAKSPDHKERQQAKKILVVEDESVTAMDIQFNLLQLGYQVTGILANGESAILQVAENPPDLILMDITLDGPLSGIQAAKEIQKSHNIPIVYLTAHADTETLKQAVTTEPFGYLPKPCNIATLMSTVEVALFKGEADAQRRKAQAALREREESLALTLKSIGDAVIATDTEGRITRMNPVAERLTGWTLAEAQTLPLIQVFRIENATTRQPVANPVQQVMESGAVVGLANHTVLISRTGQEYQIADSAAPIRDVEGQTRGVILVFSDVSERYAKEAAVRASERRYRMLFSSMQNGFALHEIICDQEGRPCDYRFLEVNPAFEGMTGLYAADIIGRTVREILPATEPYWIEAYGKVALSGEATHIKNYSAALGRYYEVEAYCPEPGRFATIIVDITERNMLEAQLHQAQKMESIGQFAGGIAHDFNNILTAILGYGGLALSQMADDSPQRANIQQMLDAADRATHLTKDLLLFSRKQISEKRPLDLNATISRVEKFLKRVIGEDVQCTTTLYKGTALVLGDAPQLQQILMNLATNARDAMPNGGTFTISTEQTDLDDKFVNAHGYGKPGPYVVISVSDTGKGMDEATREHVFEPFFTTKEEGRGTGLGLAVTYGIVKQHNGFIAVESQPGRGTTFKIALPLIPIEVNKTPPTTAQRPPGGTETILLAEDDEGVRNLTKTVLERNGYRVITAIDGQDAVDKFRTNQEGINLLLFDVVMPMMNGPEAYDQISRLKPGVKVIFYSGYAPEQLRQKMRVNKEIPMIDKPISPMLLLKMVRSELDKGQV